MKQTEISTGAQLDAQLAIHEVNERARLWRFAEGRFGWRITIGSLLPALVLVLGIVIRIYEHGLSGFMGEDPSGYFIILGMALLGLALWGNTQRQIGALRALLKGLERSRS